MKKFLTIIILLVVSNSFGQQVNLETFGLSFDEPAKWHKKGEEEFIKNVKKFNWKEGQVKKIMQSHKGSVTVCAFYKYSQNKYNGIIPTITLTLSHNPTENFEEFKQMIAYGQEQYKAVLSNFKITAAPVEIIISGKKALLCKSSYTVPYKGKNILVNTQMLYIPKGDSFYTFNFIENKSKENNSEVFDKLIKSIKLTEVSKN